MLEAFEGAKERAENNRALAKALEKRVGRAQLAAAKCGCCVHGRLSPHSNIVETEVQWGVCRLQLPASLPVGHKQVSLPIMQSCGPGCWSSSCSSTRLVSAVSCPHRAVRCQRLARTVSLDWPAAAVQTVQSHANSKQGQRLWNGGR